MTRVLVTGAGGFLGRALTARLAADGCEVVAVMRRPPAGPPAGPPAPGRVVAAAFGDSIAPGLAAAPPDAAVHLAWDLADPARNEAGTTRWAREAAAAGATRQVFVSSLSAAEDAAAAYGAAKLATEGWFTSRGQVVVRPGLVLGPGGLFGRMLRLLRKSPVIPLPDGGRQRVYFSRLSATVALLAEVAAARRTVPAGTALALHQAAPTTLRDLLAGAAARLGLRRLFVPVPMAPVEWAVRALAAQPFFDLGIDPANVKGLRQNDRAAPPSDLARLGVAEPPLAAVLDEVFAAG